MTFKIKKKSYGAIQREHYRQEEQKKPKKFFELTRESMQQITRSPAYEHRKGNVVEHKGKIMVVRKVTSKGVYLQPLEKDNLLDNKFPKQIFVKERDYELHTQPRPLITLD